MTKNNKLVLQFSLQLLLLMAVGLIVQSFILEKFSQEFFSHLILEAYCFNFFMVALNFLLLIKLKNKFPGSLAYFLMSGFLFKLLGFFIFFRPVYMMDGEILKVEFFAFFLPYTLSLFYETWKIVKLLNQE